MSLTVGATVPERGIDVELELVGGETLALVGPNGAGKSTILSLIAGTLRPATGTIALDGHVLTGPRTWVPPHHRAVTTLAQDPVLFPHLSVLGNIMFALRAQGMPRRRSRREAERWLQEIGGPELADRRPAQLSGGQAQRIAVARALAAQPDLLLLDEPLAALDVDVAPALRDLLRRVLAERSAIVVSHDVLDAVTLADRVAVIEAGRIVESGSATEVLTRPQAAFTARLAGMNLLRGVWDGRAMRLGEEGGQAILRGEPVEPMAAGTPVRATVRPARVRLHDGTDAPPTATVLPTTLTGLEPFGDMVRARSAGIAADLTPQQLAGRDLRAGAEVRFRLEAEDVSIYPAL